MNQLTVVDIQLDGFCLDMYLLIIAKITTRNKGFFDLAHIYFNTLRPRQDGRHIPDDIFKCIF